MTDEQKTPSEFKRFDFKREINAKTGIEKSWAEECSNGRYILFFDHEAAIAAERQKLETEHCKDCCCARSWEALGVTGYTGKSIPEHITELTAKNERLREEVQDYKDDYDRAYKEACTIQYGPDDRTHCTCVPSMRRVMKDQAERIKALEGAIEEFLSYSYKSFPSHSEAIEEGLRIRELCQDLLNRKEAIGSPMYQDGKVTPESKAEVDKAMKDNDHILLRPEMNDEAPGDSAGTEKEEFHGIEIWWSEEDKSYVAASGSLSGFGDSVEKALKELCVALTLAYEVIGEELDRARGEGKP